MSDKSPLFVSSMELLAHATELYALNNARKFKFVILHLANAIELIFKDRLIDKGVSIYSAKKPQTIGIWESFDQLAAVGVQIPERPVIELLVDDRNTIQHRFGYPDTQTVYFYLEQAVSFFRRFLSDEYGLDLVEVLQVHLAKPDLALLGLIEEEAAQEDALDRLFALSSESAIVQAFNLIERNIRYLLGGLAEQERRAKAPWLHPDFSQLMNELVIAGYVRPDAARKFDLLREMRNRAAHAAHFEDDQPLERWREALDVAKELLSGLDKAVRDNFGAKRRERRTPHTSHTSPAGEQGEGPPPQNNPREKE